MSGGDNGAGDLEDVNRCEFCGGTCWADSMFGLCLCCPVCALLDELAEGEEVTA